MYFNYLIPEKPTKPISDHRPVFDITIAVPRLRISIQFRKSYRLKAKCRSTGKSHYQQFTFRIFSALFLFIAPNSIIPSTHGIAISPMPTMWLPQIPHGIIKRQKYLSTGRNYQRVLRRRSAGQKLQAMAIFSEQICEYRADKA